MVKDNRVQEEFFPSNGTKQIVLSGGVTTLYSDQSLNGQVHEVLYRSNGSLNFVIQESGLNNTFVDVTGASGAQFTETYPVVEQDNPGGTGQSTYTFNVMNGPACLTISGTNASGLTAEVTIRYI